MSYEEWFHKFKPIIAAADEMLTTADVIYDPDYHWSVDDNFLAAQNEKHIWTLLDDDTVVPGNRLVNRVACFICRVPWTKANEDLQIKVTK